MGNARESLYMCHNYIMIINFFENFDTDERSGGS